MQFVNSQFNSIWSSSSGPSSPLETERNSWKLKQNPISFRYSLSNTLWYRHKTTTISNSKLPELLGLKLQQIHYKAMSCFATSYAGTFDLSALYSLTYPFSTFQSLHPTIMLQTTLSYALHLSSAIQRVAFKLLSPKCLHLVATWQMWTSFRKFKKV